MNKPTPSGYGLHYGPVIKQDGDVFDQNGQILLDSREVAESLDVDHSQLVEDIYDLEVPDDIYFANFTPDFVREGRRYIWVFYMRHIGYSLLVRRYGKQLT
ncbi:hypothetical protein ABNC92_10850 [Paenibacillus larvae]|uniref:Uncharacterized protein n=1 Tax=Paenibacillus phage Tripp TaxID=1718161 RepID=A0A0N9SSV8_9CAUD|nr:hypothetical protein [Paenibacillus larvae]YP_009210557.1 hypothetical protein TRIPP_37 [Paenibacillus phage Tripp]ALH46410.1 hypothetical protein TRIPP_37 [Paenibacillus phage Tripp]ETK28033.1 hypothetical protein ERIC1_1c14880 [Paenibacillus larvae subsp. larvae DSM 25719]MDT2294006.1 hypothetical protein [Paenibacillus larvae]